MITMAAQDLIVMGRSLKAVPEDKSKKDHEMIINWKEIESASEFNVKEEIFRIYKKYHFVQLMQFFVKKKN